MSEVLKISYRSFGGFLLLSLVFTFAASSFAFLLSGVVILAFGIYVLLYPSILEVIPVMFISSRVNDATLVFAISMVLGIVVIALGSGFLALTNGLWNYGLRLDKGLARYVDSNVPKTGELIDRVKKPITEQNPSDKISKLERLQKLLESGTLTQSEFDQEKQLILKGKE